MLKTLMIKSALIALACSVSFAAHARADQPKQLNVPAGELVTALESLSKQAAIELVYQPDQLKSYRTRGVKGLYDPQEAVRILLKGTPLELRTDPSGAMVIAPPHTFSASREKDDTRANGNGEDPKSTSGDRLRLAQTNPSKTSSSQTVDNPSEASTEASESKRKLVQLEEVIVTGTHIRDTDPVSRVVTIDRKEIKNSGFGDLDRLLSNLPENFKGGGAPDVNPITAPGATNDLTYASGVNLRGLGTDSTLVLLNGQRMAPAGTGDITGDISLIPLSVVERVEVLNDGASAVYGSDAVAGVVNVITRTDFDGFETSVRYGSVTKGKKYDYDVNQLGGFKWGSGNLILDYDYKYNGYLLARDRDFAASAPSPQTTLIPEQRSQNIYAGLREHFTPQLSLNLDALGSERKYAAYQEYSFGPTDVYGTVKQIAVGATVNYAVSPSWQASLDSSYSREYSSDFVNYPSFSFLDHANDAYRVWSVEPRINGTAFVLTGGEAKLAAGVSYRGESYTLSSLDLNDSRHSSAVFGELLLPVVGKNNAVSGASRLDISLAGRYENYTEFGHTFNPKYSVAWWPIEDLVIRGSYSTSFRAPTFFQLDLPEYGYVKDVPNAASVTGTTRTLFLDGGNPNLGPEKAKNYNFSVTYHPSALPNLQITASPFWIKYEDRFSRLFSGALLSSLYSNPGIYGNLIALNPSVGEVTSAIAGTKQTFSLVGPYTASSIVAIAHTTYQNVAISDVSGVDLSASYLLPTRVGNWDARGDATFLSGHNQITPTASSQQVVGTVYNPPRLRARLSLSWNRGAWSANTRINYVGSYNDAFDPGCAPPASACSVSTWTTVDVNVFYDTGTTQGSLVKNLRIGLDATNLFDANPPHVTNGASGSGYDPTNADPLKRYISLEITKRF